MNYHNITKCDLKNGEGIRVVLWVSGCEHKCIGCHNPQTWSKDSGIPFDDNAKLEIFEELEKDYVTGLTLSGGDPIYQVKGALELVKLFENTPLNIFVYTGFTFEELLEISKNNEDLQAFLEKIDYLVDGKFDITKKDISLRFRGSSNQRIINVKKSLKENKIICEEF